MSSVTEDVNRSDIYKLIEEARSSNNLATIEGTVDTGFEFLALAECKEVFGDSVNSCKSRGRIFFNVPLDSIHKIKELRSLDNLFLVVDAIQNLGFDKESKWYCSVEGGTTETVESFFFKLKRQPKENDLNTVKELVNQLDLKRSLEIWKSYAGFTGITNPTIEASSIAQEKINKSVEKRRQASENNKSADGDIKEVISEDEDDSGILRFRATCHRAGKHSFGSMDVARDFGGQLQDNYHWLVNLSNYDLDVVFYINNNEGYICFALTKESLHRRNITHFGPTTLRATLCYNMLRMAQLNVGDIVVDPLCGGGSITIEGALAFPKSFHVAGDIHEKAVNRSQLNYSHLCSVKGSAIPLDIFQWDVGKIPLKTASVDAFVTDLPFGKRSGKKSDNRPLYTKALREMARVVRPETGRAVLLTHDRTTFIKVLRTFSNFWSQPRPFNINLGGLEGGVFLLKRSCRIYL